MRRVREEAQARLERVVALMEAGVQVLDPTTVYLDDSVTVGKGTLLLPGTVLRGKTVIGENCEIGPNTMIRDCTVGDNVTVNASQLNGETAILPFFVGRMLSDGREPRGNPQPNCANRL